MPKSNKITSWSFSRYSVYTQCPFKAKLKFIDKLEEPGNEAMERGSMIHKKAEDFIRGEIKTLPKELVKFSDLMKDLKKQFKKKVGGIFLEETWAFRKDWSETTWNDWAGCFLRIKTDATVTEDHDEMTVIDWKTGKYRQDVLEEYKEQLELYALGAMVKFPHIKVVHPRLCFLDTGDNFPTHEGDFSFTREDLPKLKKTWEKRIKAMISDAKFAPRPNNKCCWCHFRKSNNGPCKF